VAALGVALVLVAFVHENLYVAPKLTTWDSSGHHTECYMSPGECLEQLMPASIRIAHEPVDAEAPLLSEMWVPQTADDLTEFIVHLRKAPPRLDD
jgi:hypothetical protein